MKICPKCHASVEDDANFCMNCGTKVDYNEEKRFCAQCGEQVSNEALFCPNCGCKLMELDNEPSEPINKECPVNRRQLTLKGCLVGYVDPSGEYTHAGNQIGEYTFYNEKLFFSTEKTSLFLKIQTFGRDSKYIIYYRDIVEISISKFSSRDYVLYVMDKAGYRYVIGGNGLTSSSNNEQICKIGYILELYRRLYWMYDELYQDGNNFPLLKYGAKDEIIDLNDISIDELIKKYNQL